MKVESLDDLVESDLLEIPVDTPICVDLYLYLPQNGRIIRFIHKGDSFDHKMKLQYETKGLKKVWVSLEEASDFEEWMTTHTQKAPSLRNSKTGEKAHLTLTRPSSSQKANSAGKGGFPSSPAAHSNAASPSSASLSQGALPPIAPHSSDEAGALPASSFPLGSAPHADPLENFSAPLSPTPSPASSSSNDDSAPSGNDASSNGSLPPDPDSDAMTASQSQELPRVELPMTPDEAQNSMMKAVELVFPKLQDLIQQLFNLHGNLLPRSHGVHVALYSCLLSFAFKKAEPRTISILTLASLFHDVGTSRLNLKAARSISHHGALEVQEYSNHVHFGIELLKEYLGVVDSEVLDVIRDHHERFDGSGYPSKKRSFEILTLSQILAMADTLDHLVTGSWDGTVRTLPQALEAFLTLEKDSARPVYFLPEIYTKAKELIQSPELKTSFLAAEERLRAITKEFIQKGSTPPAP